MDGEHADTTVLPADLGAAIDALLEDKVVCSWFSPEFLQTFEAIKRNEIEQLEGLTPEERCKVYSNVY